ncbi:MAG TPA: M14 family zinc carboxypeptidase [Sphingobacteriaceae bacterium]
MSTISSILERYHDYREPSLNDRFFKHIDIQPLIQNRKAFTVTQAGQSFEQRPIYLLEKGNGPVKVFLWSQMHGDEATATMALFDLFNFLEADDDFNPLRNALITSCSLFFAPMISPDGAEQFNRRNAQGLDINRDFQHQQTPEGRTLRALRDQIDPDFGFNLHDQSVFWSAGNTGNPATISLLAPAYDDRLSLNDVRKRAMQLIAGINQEIQSFIPNHVGLFDDEYEPRAFGDNFQAAGTSTILIEAGGYPNDFEKQFIRKIYFGAMLSGLTQIANGRYADRSLDEYYAIPKNQKLHFSILIKNCMVVENNGAEYRTDIGIIADQVPNETRTGVNYNYVIDDLGDLNGRFGYLEVDAAHLQLIVSKPLRVNETADLIVQDGLNTILCIENGKINEKTSKFSGD